MNFIENTGLKAFSSGDILTSESLNVLNDKINELVSYLNTLLSDSCNINQELKTPNQIYTIDQAIEKSPRRALGLTIKYLSKKNILSSITFIGDSILDESWMNKDNWINNEDFLFDGGSWS